MPDDVGLIVVARGRVQGVSFRYFVVQRARGLGLRGYVRNLPDGHSVEAVAEGRQEGLEELLRHLHQGPPEARVEQVDASWTEATGSYEGFHAILNETAVKRDG